jgi:hypothetical protein
MKGVSMEDELRSLFARLDPVPALVSDGARAAFTWRTIDAELAELMRDSAEQEAGELALRSATVGPRLLSFESPRVAIEAEVAVTGPRTRRLVGQIIPPMAVDVVLERPDERLSVAGDELGRFTFDDVAAGPARLRATLPDGAEIATPWTSL